MLEYVGEQTLIPKNTSLIISRIPVAHQVKKNWDPPNENVQPAVKPVQADNLNLDLSKMHGSEEDKIQAMMLQSTADYDPKR